MKSMNHYAAKSCPLDWTYEYVQLYYYFEGTLYLCLARQIELDPSTKLVLSCIDYRLYRLAVWLRYLSLSSS